MKRLTAIVALTFVPFAAAAQSVGVLATKRPITWGMIFALLFLMLGPITPWGHRLGLASLMDGAAPPLPFQLAPLSSSRPKQLG